MSEWGNKEESDKLINIRPIQSIPNHQQPHSIAQPRHSTIRLQKLPPHKTIPNNSSYNNFFSPIRIPTATLDRKIEIHQSDKSVNDVVRGGGGRVKGEREAVKGGDNCTKVIYRKREKFRPLSSCNMALITDQRCRCCLLLDFLNRKRSVAQKSTLPSSMCSNSCSSKPSISISMADELVSKVLNPWSKDQYGWANGSWLLVLLS